MTFPISRGRCKSCFLNFGWLGREKVSAVLPAEATQTGAGILCFAFGLLSSLDPSLGPGLGEELAGISWKEGLVPPAAPCEDTGQVSS